MVYSRLSMSSEGEGRSFLAEVIMPGGAHPCPLMYKNLKEVERGGVLQRGREEPLEYSALATGEL